MKFTHILSVSLKLSADSTNLLYSTVQLKRIADAIEEILRMVKADQEASTARQRQNDNE